MTEPLIPTESHVLWNGAVEVHCFGTRHGNWSMAGATPEEAEKNNPGILERMEQLAEQFNCMIAAPNPSHFNAKIVRPHALKSAWIDSRLYRGVFADGVVLTSRNNAFAVASADCPTIILHDRNTGAIVAAHAGRDSLVDRAALEGRAERRHRSSVVDTMVAQLGWHSLARHRAFIACGIHPHNFAHQIDDPTYGETNRLINAHIIEKWGEACIPGGIRSGHLWLAEIIRRQFAAYGIGSARIGCDSVDTYDDRDKQNRPFWHSHRRSRDFHSETDGRNLVLVIRRT